MTTISGRRANAVAPGPVAPKIRSRQPDHKQAREQVGGHQRAAEDALAAAHDLVRVALDQQRHAELPQPQRARRRRRSLRWARWRSTLTLNTRSWISCSLSDQSTIQSSGAPVRGCRTQPLERRPGAKANPNLRLGYPDLREELQACQLKCSERPMYGGERHMEPAVWEDTAVERVARTRSRTRPETPRGASGKTRKRLGVRHASQSGRRSSCRRQAIAQGSFELAGAVAGPAPSLPAPAQRGQGFCSPTCRRSYATAARRPSRSRLDA